MASSWQEIQRERRQQRIATVVVSLFFVVLLSVIFTQCEGTPPSEWNVTGRRGQF